MSKLLRTVSFASASLKTLALAIVLVLCGANTVFAQSIVCPETADVNCLGDLPMATVADLEGSGFSVDLTYTDALVSGTGCDSQIARTYVASFSRPDSSYSQMCTVVHRVADFEAPVFVDAPGDATYECIDEVPAPNAVSAQDDCNNPVVVELFENESSINDTLVCNDITTPNAPGPDYSLWLNGLNTLGLPVRYAWSGAPTLIFSSNGEARLVGDAYATNGSGYGWHIDMTLAEGMDWTAWSAQGGQPHFGTAPVSSPYQDWSYYKLLTTISRLEGLGSLAGSQLILTHQPAVYSFGFQFGAGANSMNSDNGGSGWFFYEGHVNRTSISGHGDVFLEMNCSEPNHPNVLCSQTIERRWTATDACGNVAYHTQMITVEDTTAPEFSNCPADVTVQCAADEPAMIDPSTLLATDNCDGPVTVNFFTSDTTGTFPCNYTITYTYEASDVCDNRSNCSYSVTVHDTEAPVIVTPFDYTVECIEDVFFESATVTDNCSASVNIAESVEIDTTGCVITYTRSFFAIDDCGNESSSTQTIVVRDTTNPILEVPADAEFQCNDDVVFASASASDNCTDNLQIIESVDTLNNGVDCEYTYIRTFTVSDDCGNTTIGVQTIFVKDTIQPSFDNLAGPYFLECDVVYNEEWINPAASDNCDDDLTYTYSDELTSGGCLGTIHRTVTIRDNCGNSTTQMFVIYVQDTTAPEFVSIPADMTVECSDGPMVPNTADVVASDNCSDPTPTYGHYSEYNNADIAITVEVDTIAGNCQGSYTITWTWTATDYCENENTAVTTITVIDTTAPEFISVPQNITIDCSQELPTVDVVIATDNCTTTPIVAIASDETVPGNCANSYTVERTYVATDDCGNSAEFVQYIYVVDQVEPIFNAENESIYDYQCGTTIPVIQPIAVDNCDEELEYSYNDVASGTACNQVITRTWTAADDCGRTSSFVQTINVNDTQAPVIVAAPQIQRPCSDWQTLDPSITVTDNCSNNVQLVIESDVFVSGACAGEYIRTISATDDCGNTATVEQIIVLVDNFAPVAISEPVTITVECSDEIPAYQPAWSDNCSGTWTTDMTSETFGFGCSFQIVETYSATDPCGNTGFTTRTINVVDTTAPSLVGVPANITIDCNDAIPAAGGVTATDNCDLNTVVSWQELNLPGNCASNYSIERMYIATDWCGNADTVVQTINIVDSTAPIFRADNESFFSYTCPEIAIGEAAPVVTPVAVEDCSEFTVNYSDIETGTDCNRQITRTWTAADACGNASTFVQNITIIDNEAPQFAGPNNVSAPCDNYAGILNVTATDNCSGAVQVSIDGDVISGIGCSRVVTRTYRATDNCGNSATFVQTIQLLDDVAPSVTNPPVAVTLECNQPFPVYTPNWTDNCDASLTLTSTTFANPINCATQITNRYTATDDCGNSTTVDYVITLVDLTAPTATFVAPNATIECSSFTGAAPTVAPPVFVDNCSNSPVTVTPTMSVADNGCERIYTFTWVGRDNCNNQSSVSTVITVVDNSNPVFTSVPAGGTFSCEEGINFGQATAQDACNDVTITSSDNMIAGSCPGEYQIVRTWTASDGCGNSTQAQSTYTVVDNTAPIFTSVPETLILNCIVVDLPATVAVATDNCNGPVTINYNDELVLTDNCERQYERTFTATDECGNTATATQVIIARDSEGPVFAGASEITVNCGDFDEAAIYVEANDNCGTATVTIISTEVISGTACTTIRRNYAAFDGCGNDSYFVQDIQILDNEAPVASTFEANVTYSCTDQWSPAAVTFTDNCDQSVNVVENVQTSNQGCTVIYAYSWTATDACGNSTTVSQTVTIVDDIAPVINDSNSEQTVSCDELVEFATPTATDFCAGDVAVTVAVENVGDDCDRTITTTFRAEDGCGNSSEVTHIVHYVDEAGPVWSAGNQVDFSYECGTTPPVTEPIATDNCNSITYSSVDGEPFAAGVGCLTAFNRTWTATDACGNNSVAFVQTITFVDTTEPVLSGCPSDLVLDCTAAVPAAAEVSATDNCDNNVTVEFNETIDGTVTNGSNLYTPVRPAANSCNYPYDWAMALFSLPSQYRWYQLDPNTTATMVDNGDGSLTISGRLFNVLRPDGGFNFNVTYAEGLNWADWSALSNPNGFKADCGGEAANHPSWMYYILQSSSAAELTGWGRFAGSSIHLTHAPSNEYFGFQVGDGANNYNGDNGAGGWFLYGGDGDSFLENGETILSGNFAQQGIGDFAFRVEDCPGYSIIRTWTAVDCEGNESSCTQTITFASLDNNVAGMDMTTDNNDGDRSAEIAIVGIMPNPATDRSQISFMSTVDGKLSLQVLDMTGRVVGDLFNNQAEAGQVYTAEFDANVMSSGIYMVRLTSGTAFQMERLLIQK